MADGTILHQPTPDEPREASTGDNHQATNAAREIGPVDGSMTAADVELVDLDTGSTIAWPADQPIERQVRRP